MQEVFRMRWHCLGLLGWLLTLTIAAKAAEEDAKNGTYVKIEVQVEIRGTLRHTDKGTLVFARERVVEESPGSDFGLIESKEVFLEVSWKLDLSKVKDAKGLVGSLTDKAVVASGTAEMRMVIDNTKVGRGIGQRSSPQRWEVVRTLSVTSLKAVGEK